MIPRVKSVIPMENYILDVVFDDNVRVHYDMKEDISSLPGYDDLRNIQGLYQNVQLDLSRTCIYWNEYIDLPSDTIYEYGNKII
ncbi:MAG: DUF2442 domain-containing protein [Treponema sp.]|jgi:hypothetical protein|nr:DUF2442 domain-containing protein [Treponema sp.]